MPITSWRCPACLLPQDLNHFSVSACGEIVHPDYAAAVLAEDRERSRRVGVVGVTDGLGCARKKLIQDTEELTVDPLAYNAPLTGTAFHNKLAAHSDDPHLCEVEVAGTIMGIEIVGHIDRVRITPTGLVADDFKHTNSWSFKYLKAGEAKPEHEWQLSVYAELYFQQFGASLDHGMLWYHDTAGGFLPKRVDLWSLDRCLAFKPYGGDYTTADLWLQVLGGQQGDWRNLPLVGESMSFGSKTACDYCAVRELCWTQARGASF